MRPDIPKNGVPTSVNTQCKFGTAIPFTSSPPAFICLMENQHPPIVTTQALQSTLVTQRPVQSNLKNGFCIFLRQSMPEAMQWRVSTINGRNDMAQPFEDGYQVCVRQPGLSRQTLELTHSFESSHHRRDVAIAEQICPITTDLMGL